MNIIFITRAHQISIFWDMVAHFVHSKVFFGARRPDWWLYLQSAQVMHIYSLRTEKGTRCIHIFSESYNASSKMGLKILHQSPVNLWEGRVGECAAHGPPNVEEAGVLILRPAHHNVQVPTQLTIIRRGAYTAGGKGVNTPEPAMRGKTYTWANVILTNFELKKKMRFARRQL